VPLGPGGLGRSGCPRLFLRHPLLAARFLAQATPAQGRLAARLVGEPDQSPILGLLAKRTFGFLHDLRDGQHRTPPHTKWPGSSCNSAGKMSCRLWFGGAEENAEKLAPPRKGVLSGWPLWTPAEVATLERRGLQRNPVAGLTFRSS